MFRSRAPRWRLLFACAVLAAGAAAAVTTTAQSSAEGWTGYGGGPDNSRCVPSTQITRASVTRLQVAWTYPFGDAGSSPIVVRGVICGRGATARWSRSTRPRDGSAGCGKT